MDNTGTTTTETQTTAVAEQGAENSAAAEQTTEKTYSQQEFTDELNKQIKEAVKAAQDKWNADVDTKLKEAKNEGERLAKLSAKERDEETKRLEYERFQQDKAEFEHKTLIYETTQQLAAKNLPVELAEMSTGNNAEDAKKYIGILERSWNKAIEAEVTKRLAGSPPKSGTVTATGGSGGDFMNIIRENQRI